MTTGEWADTLRKVFGEYRAQTGVQGARIADGDGWQLRLADIDESGPFSDFSGYLRLFAIVDD